MIRKIFSVYDDKAHAYANPFYFSTKGEAIRAFSSVCNEATSQLNKYPSDFKLYMLGELDDQSGVITSLSIPEYLGTASEFIEKK